MVLKLINDDFTTSTDGDDKLMFIYPYPLSRLPQVQREKNMSVITFNAFMSINATIGWFGITPFAKYSFLSIYLPKRFRYSRVLALLYPSSVLTFLQLYGTTTLNLSPRLEKN